MCGIFGVIPILNSIDKGDFKVLSSAARQRGRDSSGLLFPIQSSNELEVYRSDSDIIRLRSRVMKYDTKLVCGHSRLITNGETDNQPVIKKDICVLHNGIIVNSREIWDAIDKEPELKVDSEVIAALALNYFSINEEPNFQDLCDLVLSKCEGVVATAIVIGRLGKLLLLSNNGSLYFGKNSRGSYFSSESYPLAQIGCTSIEQVRNVCKVIDIPKFSEITVIDERKERVNIVPKLGTAANQERMLEYPRHDLRRCSCCILPETMPFITFNEKGVCNYCRNYSLRNSPKAPEELSSLIEKYRKNSGPECIVPFSGGRDSSYGLHLIVEELKMKPITYTYDWGMVTDLGRRNISRMCSKFGVENIIIAADVEQKRRNIKKNLKAWLKSPHLGMISILTAGDKHFFKHIETVKKQTGVSLNLWGINPLEVTHFKAGFLGIPPDFEEKRVYSHGVMKQLRYQSLRISAMAKSLGYFNSSLWDTLSGEYYRSFTKKEDYFHIFDYWRWDEQQIDSTLDSYRWERAPDTNTTWRIGDGTAAFYNYVYYLVAGFTEHDTFRSNQIREGEITRDRALAMVEDENRPRYPNIKWYLDAVDVDYEKAISIVNKIKRMY